MNVNALAPAGRILLAVLFLLSGINKIFAPQQVIGYIAHVGLPLPVLGYALAVALEVGGGLLLLVGYKTRFAAIALAVFSVAAALLFHSALGDQNQFAHFMKNLAIAGGLLHVAAFGAGAFSVDARRGITTALAS